MDVSASSLPRNDADFDAFVGRFFDRIKQQPDRYHADAERLEDLENRLTAWRAAYRQYATLRQQTDAARQVRDAAAVPLRRAVRSAVRMVRDDYRLDADDLAAVGLAPPAVRGEARSVSIVEATPVVGVTAGGRLRHVVRVHDADDPAGRRVWPDGVDHVEVRRKLGGDPSQLPGDYAAAGSMRRRRMAATFDDADAGSTVFYLARYVDRAGRSGPWSAVAAAVVPVM